ncbi:MAG: hypothetical protein Fur005_22680 [Roseiflexaceae bacterium]
MIPNPSAMDPLHSSHFVASCSRGVPLAPLPGGWDLQSQTLQGCMVAHAWFVVHAAHNPLTCYLSRLSVAKTRRIARPGAMDPRHSSHFVASFPGASRSPRSPARRIARPGAMDPLHSSHFVASCSRGVPLASLPGGWDLQSQTLQRCTVAHAWFVVHATHNPLTCYLPRLSVAEIQHIAHCDGTYRVVTCSFVPLHPCSVVP